MDYKTFILKLIAEENYDGICSKKDYEEMVKQLEKDEFL